MACYVRILESVNTEDLVEIPTEDDGSLLLSSVSAQFPDAVGLRYKAESGSWRGVRLQDNIMKSPAEGWGDSEYYVIKRNTEDKKKPLKREAEDHDIGPSKKLNKVDASVDLMVASLPYSATDDEIKSHFEKFGELDMCDIKHDKDGKSRGFGFLRYKTAEGVETALAATHILKDRKCELRYSKRSLGDHGYEDIPTKLFIGRIPRGTTTEELKEHFSQYGDLKDVYIPTPPRGYGFVTFSSQIGSNKAIKDTHSIKGQFLNVSYPNEKRTNGMMGQLNPGYGNMQGGGFGNMHGGGFGNMQGGGFGNMQGGGFGNMQGGGFGNKQGGGFGNMQGGMQSYQMGNMQSNMSGGMNTKPWMQGNMQAQNGGSNNVQPRFGYGYQNNGNYSNLGSRQKAQTVS